MNVIIASVSNVVSSVALILANKRAVAKDGFDFMIVLTGLHFYASFLCCIFLLMIGTLHYKMVKNYSYLMRIAGASLMSIVFMNLNLKYNSVGFYQISKLLCIPTSLLIETCFGLRKQKLTRELLISLVLIIIGMYLVIESEANYNAERGLLFMCLGVLSTAVAQIWFAPLQRDLGLDSMQLLFHTSPLMAFSAFAITPLCEDTPRLLKFQMNTTVAIDLLLSCLMAFLLNLSNYKVLELTSPLTYQVLGHVKTVSILTAGVVFLNETPSGRVLAGVIVSILGMLLYGYESYRQKSTDVDKNKVTDKIQTGSDDSSSQEKGRALSVSSVKDAFRLRRLDIQASPPSTPSTSSSPMSTPFASAFAQTAVTAAVSATEMSTVPMMQRFDDAVTKIGSSTSAKPTNAQKLQLYAYFKFVKQGPCNTTRPGWTDPVGQAKWDAWKGMDASLQRDDVIRMYESLVHTLVNGRK